MGRTLGYILLALVAAGSLACGSSATQPSKMTLCTTEIVVVAVKNGNQLESARETSGGYGSTFVVGAGTDFRKLDSTGRVSTNNLADILSAYRSGNVQRLRLEKSVEAQSACYDGFGGGALDTVTVIETLPPTRSSGSEPIYVTGNETGTWKYIALVGWSGAFLLITPWTEVDPAGASWEAVASAGSACLHYEGFNMVPLSWKPTFQATKVRFELPSRGMACSG